ncbi:MAG: MBL fold metallo-hydrolase [Pseudolabrys sp.]|nr:MBL fold metallo-hydrolase [Pseudolabrys sp.]
MKLTVIGSGDAFGSGGRSNTCFLLDTAKRRIVVDCGASAPPALKKLGVDFNTVDAVMISHLHGDHFGGLPFLLLDAQFLARRERPLLVAGPPGTRDRLHAAMEVFFPKSTGSKWKFAWSVQEIEVGVPSEVLGHSVVSTETIHQSGAPSTAVRIDDGAKKFSYSGDGEWSDALIPIASGADLFVCDCYGYSGKLTGHLSWETLKNKLGELNAKRLMITHMNPTMLARIDEARASGVLIAEDGLTLEF